MNRLTKIFGIKSISPVFKTTQNLEDMKQLCVSLAKDFANGDTFKVDVKRVDKSFSLDTYQLQRELGGAILKAVDHLKVDVKRPTHNIKVEVRKKACISILKLSMVLADYLPVQVVKHFFSCQVELIHQ